MKEYKSLKLWKEWIRDNFDITIKRVGPEKFPRYVLAQGGKYYCADGEFGAFPDALWFETLAGGESYFNRNFFKKNKNE